MSAVYATERHAPAPTSRLALLHIGATKEATMTAFVALVQKEPNSDFGVSFPDFPGCVTAGATLEEARELAAEALAFHIEGMIADGEVIPRPSALEDVERREATAILVEPISL